MQIVVRCEKSAKSKEKKMGNSKMKRFSVLAMMLAIILAFAPWDNVYTLDYSKLEFVTFSGPVEIEKGNSYKTVLTADEGYTLPEEITVKVRIRTLVPSKHYTYNYDTGEVEIFSEVLNNSGTIYITAVGVPAA